MNEIIDTFVKSSEEFITTIHNTPLEKPVYNDGWNARQIMSHVIFWQEYYASVAKAVASDEKLPLIEGSLIKSNVQSGQKFSKFSKTELISRFQNASNNFIENMKFIHPRKNIPYSKGGRIYTAKEYLDVITKHLIKHTKDIKRNHRK